MKRGILDNAVVEQIVLKRFALLYKEIGSVGPRENLMAFQCFPI